MPTWARKRIENICRRLKQVTAQQVLDALQAERRFKWTPTLHQLSQYLPYCRYLAPIERDKHRNRPVVYIYKEMGRDGEAIPDEDSIIVV